MQFTKRHTTTDTPLQQDKNKSQEEVQAFPLSVLLGKWVSGIIIVSSLGVLYHGYVHIRGLETD